MQTSYLSKVKTMTDMEKGRCISICNIRTNFEQLGSLTPSYDLVQSFKNSAQDAAAIKSYILQYIRDNLEPTDLQALIAKHSTAILLCCEGAGKFCHRRVIAKWIEYHYGIVVPEYGTSTELEIDKYILEIIRGYYNGSKDV